MKQPLVSVIIPVYNTKRYLKTCVESVLNQTYKELEIVLVDDGSTDGSDKMCNEYQKKDDRIIVIHKPNGGLSSARNRGLDICTGEYVTFVDSDDYIDSDFIEYTVELAKKHNAKLAVCAHNEKNEHGKPKNFGKGQEEACFKTDECLERMLLEKGFMVSTCSKLYQTKLFKDVRFPVGKLHEDVGVTYKLILKCPKIAYGPEPKYTYFQRKGSITKSAFNIQKFDLLVLTDQMCNDIDAEYPKLKDVTNKRRMHARFSILRQMVNSSLTPELKQQQQSVVQYLKNHKDYILKNPKATLRDKIAMRSLLLGKGCFKFSWNIYSKIRH